MWNAAILLASVRSRRLQRVQRRPQTSHAHAPLLRAPSVRTRVAVSSTSAAHPHPRTAAPGDRLSRPHCLGLRPPRLSLVTLQGSPGEAWDTAPPRQTAPGGSLHFTGLKIGCTSRDSTRNHHKYGRLVAVRVVVRSIPSGRVFAWRLTRWQHGRRNSASST